MAKLGFYFDMTACTGCRTCQVACKDKNALPIGTLYRNVKNYETGVYPSPKVFNFSFTCNHCEEPACVLNCPTGAMYKTEEGPVLHDDQVCIGCQTCVQKCPYSVPKYLDEKAITGKCDTCVAIRANGNDPQCVASCLMRAIEFGDIDELKAAHPDAISVVELPFMKSDTVPTTLVSIRDHAMGDVNEVTL